MHQCLYDLIDIQPMWLKLEEASVYNINDDILFFRFHHVIARQTEPAPENIGSYIDSGAFYVRICASASISGCRDERVGAVYRLHMHGLPAEHPLS